MRSRLLLAILGLTTGCATLFRGTTETITLRSDQPDTRFFLNERDLGSGQSAVTVVPKRQLGSSVLRAEKNGCATRQSKIETAFDPVTLLGVLIDFGVVTVLLVDGVATGAIRKAAQTYYVLTPDCSPE